MGSTTDPLLEEYRSKRNFYRTPEPSGNQFHPSHHNMYVIQKHAASHLHYDLRLALHGSLKSWAILKGPSSDPTVRRLATQTEDHPLEYGGFEGVIPVGEYGAGTVMIWDIGELDPLEGGKQDYYRGNMRFILHGRRLHGIWKLTRQGKESRQWYLQKEEDEHSLPADTALEESSIISGRTMNEIRQSRNAVWTRSGLSSPASLPIPDFIAPQLASQVANPPDGDEWLHEIKFDGYRILCRIDKGRKDVRLYTRRGIDFTNRLQNLSKILTELPITSGWLDGEIVILTEEGRSDFNALQNAITKGNTNGITYMVFDLMYINGRDLRQLPLSERKALLSTVIPHMEEVRYVDHVIGSGGLFLREACAHGLEGIVSKRADSAYVSDRSRRWLKIKCPRAEAMVIGGYTESGAGRPFGSLLAGQYDEEGRLEFIGKIKTGFNRAATEQLLPRMQAYEQPDPPFANPPSGVEYRNPHWLKPGLLAEVEYTEITSRTKLLRHASFKGLIDKSQELHQTGNVEVCRQKGPAVFPRDRINRDDIRNYYTQVAERMIPHLRNRPLTLIVCRNNIFSCKFTKHATRFPSPVIPIDVEGHLEKYLAIDSAEGILSLVDHGAIEFHGWQSRYPALELPDRMVFDLDPPEGVEFPWERLGEAALRVRIHLQQHELESFIQTTGGKGYYIVSPLTPSTDWKSMTFFAKRCAQELAAQYPDLFTAELAKEKRGDRIYIDWMRNGRGANAAEPYSLRARNGAPVATPITWEELVGGTRPDTFNMWKVLDRIEEGMEPWQQYFFLRQRLPLP